VGGPQVLAASQPDLGPDTLEQAEAGSAKRAQETQEEGQMDLNGLVGLGNLAMNAANETLPTDDAALEAEYQQALDELKEDRPHLDDGDGLMLAGAGLAGLLAGVLTR
jgi:hypothetical protein